MKRKHLYIILALLALAVLIYAPSLVRGPDVGGPVDTGEAFALTELTGATVAEVHVSDPDEGDTIRLVPGDGGWTVNGHRADSAKVADLLSALDSVRTADLRARNPENHARMGVDEEGGRRVRIATAGGEEATFFLGDRDITSGDYFVRRDGEDAVFLLGGPLGGYLGRDRDGWRDRIIGDVDTAAVREVLVTRDGEETALVRGEEGWTVDGSPADSATAAGLIGQLVGLRATGFPADSAAEAADFEAPDASVSVFSEGGDDVTDRDLVLSVRLVAPEDGGPWLVKRADDPEVYEVSAGVAERLAPTREALVGEG